MVQTLSKTEIIYGGENDLHLEFLVEPATSFYKEARNLAPQQMKKMNLII